MRVAVFLDNEKMNTPETAIICAVIFEIIGDLIIKIDEEFLIKKDINYLSLWLISENIKIIFLDHADNRVISYFEGIGVKIKTLCDLKSNAFYMPILKQLNL